MELRTASNIRIIDITRSREWQKYLYKCLAPMPYRKYSNRQEYLQKAIPEGFHKKILTIDGEVVGSIEYAPAPASGYPITGDNLIVMNCVWVLRKAKGRNFGKLLVEDMTKSEGATGGFATIALENHWSPWFRKNQIEKLGFKPLGSFRVTHKTKHKDQSFKVYLMWMPATETSKPPTWNKQQLLRGETFCIAHPLYRPKTCKEAILKAK